MTAPIVTVRGEASLQGPPDLATLSVTGQVTVRFAISPVDLQMTPR